MESAVKKPGGFLKFKSIMSKVVLALVLISVVLAIGSATLVYHYMTELEEELVQEVELSGIRYMEDYLGKGDWKIENHSLYKGENLIGDATGENANIGPFEELEKKTGTFFYVFMLTEHLDPEIKAGIDAASDHFTGYVRVAGSTKDASGNSIVGTYIDEAVDKVLREDGMYAGAANVQGRPIFCRYENISDGSGNVVGCVVTGRSIEEVNSQIRKGTVRSILFVVLMLLLATVAMVLIFRVWIKAIDKTKNYLQIIGTGDLPETPLKLDTKDEMDDIANSVNEMVVSLKEKQRIGAELNLARDIQKNLLPKIFPPFPEHDEFEIYATMDAAKEVGGDFYDMFLIDDSTLGFLVGDVSGKGVPASLFMGVSKTLIKNYAQNGLSPAEVYMQVNNLLCENNEQNLFVTSWMGYLNLNTGILTYVNAGHNPPVLRNGADGSFGYIKGRTGFVLGGMENLKYTQQEMQLQPGSRLFLYTDGVTGATDINGELYGEERLLDFLEAKQGESVEQVPIQLKEDLDVFVKGAEQFDDITMLMVEYRKHSEAGEKMVEREFAAADSALNDITAFAEEEFEKAELPMKTIMTVNVAIEEVFVNIAHYAYKGSEGNMKFGIQIDDGLLTLKFTDWGVPFDPLKKSDPDITLSAEERQIGGLGIFMVKKTMDDVKYEYKDGMNILTLEKKI